MNNGAFGENFPYSNFHDLNMDWIIKIAKDFLDQYTHIQEIIETGETSLTTLTAEGLEQIQTKADELEALLQQWYDTHSEDIANELADALATINSTLQTQLNTTINAFTNYATEKQAQVIASIPADYTELNNQVDNIDEILAHIIANLNSYIRLGNMNLGYYVRYDTGAYGNNPEYSASDYIPIEGNTPYTITCNGPMQIALYNGTTTDYYLTGYVNNNTPSYTYITTPATATYMRICCKTSDIDSLNMIKGTYQALHLKNNVLQNVMTSPYNNLVDSGNYSTSLSDLNAIHSNSIYRLNFANQATNIPLNTPFGSMWMTNKVVTFVCLANYDIQNRYVGDIQYFITYDGIFYRMYASAWEEWKCLRYNLYVNKADHVSPFTALTPAIIWANQYDNITVYVGKKDYYLIGEFTNYYGADFFDNFDNSSPKGLYLTRNIKVIFEQGAKVWFGYTGSNDSVKTLFSPFNFDASCIDGFTLENADIYVSNGRYCVHDDPGDMARPYTNKYINCRMEISNSGNTNWKQTRCIGAGLGRNTTLIIDGGQYRGVDFEGRLYDDIILVHNDVNNAATTAKSHVVIKDLYLRGGTIGIVYGGVSTQQTDVEITNCSTVGNIEKYAIGGNYGQTDNMTIRQWNNEVR